MKMNETLSTIMNRTSVRRFTDEPVSNDDVHLLLQAAMAAPSSMTLCPWHFIVINNETTKAQLQACLPYAKMLSNGCTGIVVCGDESLYDRINRIDEEDNTLYWVEDCSAASENLLLAAHAIGLGAVWTGIYPLQSRVKKLRELLHIPPRIVPLNLIVIGHPAGESKPMNKWDASRIHLETF